MSMEIHVFFRGKLPMKAALGKTMKELGFPLSLKPATGSLEGQSGYMPMRLKREETGVEFDVFEGRSAIDEFELDGVDPSFDRVGNFRWGGDEDEMLAAMCGAAALAKLVNGIVFDEASDRLLSPDQATEMAREHLHAAAPKETKQSGTRPADIKRYLKPLLELRPDLVLIDRMLIIRPVRHLLRGAFFDRTSDKYTFRIWRYLQPLYDGEEGVGYGGEMYWWQVWQPHFSPLLIDCLAEEVFEWVGKILMLEDFAEKVQLAVNEGNATTGFYRASLEALVLAGERDRAFEYVEKIERRGAAWLSWAEKQREFLSRDIEDVCHDFHAKEVETARALKLGDVWEPAPFPAELPESERASRSADPLFRPTSWIPRPPGLFGDPPEVCGEVRFAKSTHYRGGRPLLVVPLTPAEAEERHRNFEPYVLAARLEGGILALFHRDGNDRHDPNRPKNWPPGYTPGLRIRLSRSDHFVRAWCQAEWDKKLPQLFHLEVDKSGVRDVWSCYFNHKEGELLIYDYRTGEKVYTNFPLTSRERDLTMFAPLEFGQFDDLVGRIFAAMQVAGYGEFT